MYTIAQKSYVGHSFNDLKKIANNLSEYVCTASRPHGQHWFGTVSDDSDTMEPTLHVVGSTADSVWMCANDLKALVKPCKNQLTHVIQHISAVFKRKIAFYIWAGGNILLSRATSSLDPSCYNYTNVLFCNYKLRCCRSLQLNYNY